MMLLCLILSLAILWSSGDSSGSGNWPVIVRNPFLYYDHWIQLRCISLGSLPLQVSWLVSNSSDLSNAVLVERHQSHIYLSYSENITLSTIGSALNILSITSADVGYYFCRANNSLGYVESDSLQIQLPYMPKLNSTGTDTVHIAGLMCLTWEINGFPLPDIYIEHQYLVTLLSQYQELKYNYHGFHLVDNHYHNLWQSFNDTNLSILISKIDDHTVLVRAHFLYSQLYALRLIAAVGNREEYTYYTLQRIPGHPFLQISSVSDSSFNLTCVCSECHGLEWRRNDEIFTDDSYEVVDYHRSTLQSSIIYEKYSSIEVSLNDTSNFSCISVYDSDMRSASIFPPLKPEIVQQSRFVSGRFNKNVTFICAANGSDPLTIDWIIVKANNSHLAINESQFTVTSTSSGGPYPTVTSTITFRTRSIALRCKATSSFILYPLHPPLELLPAHFSRSGPSIHQFSEESAVFLAADVGYLPPNIEVVTKNVTENDEVVLRCRCDCDPFPKFTWYYGNESITPDDYFNITTDPPLTVLTIYQSNWERDEGIYRCELPRVVMIFHLTVFVTPDINIEPSTINNVLYQQNITFFLNISRANPPIHPNNITWSLLDREPAATDQGHYLISRDRRQLTIVGLTKDDEGCFEISVWHITTGRQSYFPCVSVAVIKPQFTEHPQNKTELVGSNITLSCAVNGSKPFEIDWIHANNGSIVDKEQFYVETTMVDSRYDLSVQVNSTVHFKLALNMRNPLKLKCRGKILCGMKIYDECIAESFEAVITIQVPGYVSTEDHHLTAIESNSVIMRCLGGGNPIPNITWSSRKMANLSVQTNYIIKEVKNVDTFESDLIICKPNRSVHEDAYTCKVDNNITNLIGSKQNTTFNLTIQVPPVMSLLGYQGSAVVGTNVTLSVNISNAHPPVVRDNITWSFRHMNMNESVQIMNGTKHHFSYNKRNLTIIGVTNDDEGVYQLKVSHPAGEQMASKHLSILTATELPGSNDIPSIISVPTVSSFVIFVTIVIAVIVIYWRVHRKHNLEMEMSKPNEDYSLIEPEYCKTLIASLIISSTELKILDCIGQGEFGKVYRGHYYKGNGECDTVAVKTLKDILGRYNRESAIELFEESLVMQTLDHPNVMGLIGVCLDAGPSPYIVLPYMAGGSLLKYLTKNRSSLMTSETDDEDEIVQIRTQLLNTCHQISKGMCYISRRKLVHRDLSARNCMIDDKGIVKVSDFGLSKDVYEKVYFREAMTSGVKLPIKWMAIESIQDGIFTEKTDIWSFGITVWEVFNGGMTPYGGFSPTSVKRLIVDGYRLDPPSLVNTACNEDIYQKLMLNCWEKDSEKRPTFAEVEVEVETILINTAGYLELLN